MAMKRDWAYKASETVWIRMAYKDTETCIRIIAAALRRAEKRGLQIERTAWTLRQSLPKVK